MSKINNPVPACGHLQRSRKCRICQLSAGRQERAFRVHGYMANIAGKPIDAWPRIGKPYSGEWYRRKNCWQAGWQAAQNRPELPIDEWTRKNTQSTKSTPEHRIKNRPRKHPRHDNVK